MNRKLLQISLVLVVFFGIPILIGVSKAELSAPDAICTDMLNQGCFGFNGCGTSNICQSCVPIDGVNGTYCVVTTEENKCCRLQGFGKTSTCANKFQGTCGLNPNGTPNCTPGTTPLGTCKQMLCHDDGSDCNDPPVVP